MALTRKRTAYALIQDGALSLTQISQAQALFHEVKPTTEEKRDILNSIENQSSQKTNQLLAEQGLSKDQAPKEKAVKGGGVRVELVLNKELLKQMEEIEILRGKKLSRSEINQLAVKTTLERLRTAPPQRLRSSSEPKPVSRFTICQVKQRAEPPFKALSSLHSAPG